MWQDWLSFGLRWIHLIAGISWIGTSFYFMWLDSNITRPTTSRESVEGELWMVHSGGFYRVEKRWIGPGQMPSVLHWFKYEALLTLISGVLLIAVVYYLRGGSLLLDPQVSSVTAPQAIAISCAFLVGSWFLYDWLWGEKRSPILAGICSLALAVGITFFLCETLSGRAAFLHVGAIMGILMVANVWIRILPAQQRMIDSTHKGEKPDFEQGIRAKQRSTHNSYMTFPVLFIMLSNHYPMLYGHAFNGWILILLIVLGVALRHVMLTEKGKWAAAPAAFALMTLIGLTQYTAHNEAPPQIGASFAQARAVVNQRCLSCHSRYPTDDLYTVAPKDVIFDDPESIQRLADRIKLFAVDSTAMPLANKTQMTEDERKVLGAWIESGAALQ